MELKTAVLVQARINSTRYPEKILKKIELPSGKKISILKLLLERLEPLKNSCIIGIVTTNTSIDDKVATFAKDNNIYCFPHSSPTPTPTNSPKLQQS